MGSGTQRGDDFNPALFGSFTDHNATIQDFDYAEERVAAGFRAGQEYIGTLESIRDDLEDGTTHTGTTLGRMVAAQMQMTEAETKYMIDAGLPKKASQAVATAAGDIKKAAGG